MARKLTKNDIIDILCEYFEFSREELVRYDLSKLNALLTEERKNSSADLYPNGRNFDEEDEDCF